MYEHKISTSLKTNKQSFGHFSIKTLKKKKMKKRFIKVVIS